MNKKTVKWVVLLLPLVLAGCIGEDGFDEMMVDKRVTVEVTDKNLEPNQQTSGTALYYNEFGIEQTGKNFIWESSDQSILTVSSSGLITAGTISGEASIIASFEGVKSESVKITVSTNDEIAQVVIASADNKTKLKKDETLQLSFQAQNAGSTVLTRTAVWSSSAPSIATVDQNGLVTALADGNVIIRAVVERVIGESDLVTGSFDILVGELPERRAILMGTGGYDAEGIAVLSEDENGDVILSFGEDFKADIAIATNIYLSNTTAGQATKSGGLNLGEIAGNGAITFNVSNFKSDVTLEEYQYVIVLCQPFGITFGFGELK